MRYRYPLIAALLGICPTAFPAAAANLLPAAVHTPMLIVTGAGGSPSPFPSRINKGAAVRSGMASLPVHLPPSIRTPALIVVGTGDTLGQAPRVNLYSRPSIGLHRSK